MNLSAAAPSNTVRMHIRPRVTCPHCWANFATEEILWVAEHEDLRGDPRLGSDAHQRFLPTRFDIAGNAIDSKSMTCQALACPTCHLTIPRVLVDMAPIFVSILGIPSCGKSYFLASMTWRLRQLLAQKFFISFTDADPISNEIINQYERQQFFNPDRGSVVKLAKTEEQGHMYDAVRFGEQIVNYPRPFLFGIKPMQGHPSMDKSAEVSRVLCMYDNAGESFQPGKDTVSSPVTRHLARSQVLLFLFDPTQDPRFLAACQGKSLDPQMATNKQQVYRQDTVLHEAATRVRKFSGLRADQQHNRPLIVVVTKYDAWQSLLPEALETPPLKEGKAGAINALDLDRISDTSQQVRDLLFKYCPEIVAGAEGFAQNVTYIPVSATGCSPVVDAQGGIQGMRVSDISPQWVEAPMLYVMSRWCKGLIPYTSRTPLSSSEGRI